MVWLKTDRLVSFGRDVRPAPTPTAGATPAPETPILGPTPAPEPLPGRGTLTARLRQLLEDGHFPPGSRLPPERALAAQFGMGRPSMREAIKSLSALGL